MKFTPIMIFIFILVVLALSILFGNSVQRIYDSFVPSPKEGFLNYNYEPNSPFKKDIIIPQYSSTRKVHRLYDLIYYDPVSGALILLHGAQYVAPGTGPGTEIESLDIQAYDVFTREGTKLSLTDTIGIDSYEHPQSKVTELLSLYKKSFQVTASNAIDAYEILYIQWGKETYIHIIQLGKNSVEQYQHLRTYAYNTSGQLVKSGEQNGITYDSNAIIKTEYTSSKTQSDNGTYKRIEKYGAAYLYQVCKNMYYNPANGELVSIPDDASISVYSRPNLLNSGLLVETKTTLTAGVKVPVSSVFEAVDGFSAGVIDVAPEYVYTVLYISIGNRTLLLSLSPAVQGSDHRLNGQHAVLFGGNKQPDKGPDPVKVEDATPPATTDEPKDAYRDISEYYRLLLGLSGATDKSKSLSITNDYMLKSQIVPPVCPTCPACHRHTGVCTNCGGTGGSGTQTNDKTGDSKKSDDTDSGLDLLESAGSGATSLVRDAGSGAASLVRDTASGTVGLAKDATTGTVGLAKETVGGAVGLAKETVGGAVGLAKEAGSGIANTFGKLDPTEVSSQNDQAGGEEGQSRSAGSGASSSVTTGSDHTSYFGALPPKGGDYIPVTADFSRFGR
jgi:hypothetical protein